MVDAPILQSVLTPIMAQSADHLSFAIFSMKLYGSHNLFIRLINWYITTPALFILEALILWDLINSTGSILEITEIYEAFATFVQVIIRDLMFMSHMKLILEVFEERNKFWSFIGHDQEKDFEKSLKTGKRIETIYRCTTSVTIVLILLNPFLVEDAELLPLPCWVPYNNRIWLYIIFVAESVLLLRIFIGIAYETLIMLLCKELKIQFLLIIDKLKSVDFEKAVNEQDEKQYLDVIKSCAQHYNLILDLHRKINTIYSFAFLIQYGLNSTTTCIEFYLITNENLTLSELVKCIAYVGGIFATTLLMYWPVNELTELSEKLCETIYSINWYATKNKNIHQVVQFMMLKSQQPLVMTAYKLFIVDRARLLEGVSWRIFVAIFDQMSPKDSLGTILQILETYKFAYSINSILSQMK